MSGIVFPNRYRYEYVPPSAVNQVLGINGRIGDYLHRFVVRILDPGACNLILTDGATVIQLISANAAVPRGALSLEINIASRNGPWMVSTGTGISVIGVGVFS